MLQWSPVVEHEIIQLTPLDNAIETMEVANNSIRDLIQEFKVKKDAQVNKLSMKIKGIIDAEVNGGTAMYERAFINDQYEEAHPEDMEKIDRLKDLMATQIPLLSIGLQIHDFKKPESLTMFHEQLENMFQQMKKKVEEKYGTRPSEFAFNTKQEVRSSDEIELRSGGGPQNDQHQNPSSSASSSAMPKISINTFDDSRESYQSQSSFDGTPMSRAKGFGASVFGGIASRKSNLGHNLNRNDESRASVNSNASMQNNHHHHHGGGGSNSHHNRSVDTLNSLDDATTMIITDTIRHTSTNNSSTGTTRQNSRPSSGSHQQYFLNSTSTPNHSRSPSMTSNSNRDSMISNASNSSNVDCNTPPSLPPKRDLYSSSNNGADTFSLTNFGCDTSSNNSGSQEEIYTLRKLTKKKGPPPPPPIIDETEVTPTPPRKPALRPPT
jgi:dedicator of cytokinesis protein 1